MVSAVDGIRFQRRIVAAEEDSSSPGQDTLSAIRSHPMASLQAAIWTVKRKSLHTIKTRTGCNVRPSRVGATFLHRTGRERHDIPLTDSGLGDEALKAAQAQIAELDHVLLSRFQVVGNYVRYDEYARNILKDMRQKILEGFYESSKGSRNYLVWGEPGCGKSYFVEQIADSIRGIDYDEINRTESTSQQALCLVDEVDAKLGEPWPYEVLLRHLEAPKTVSKQVCFILAGSSGNSLDVMVTRNEKRRPQGIDLWSRI